MESGERKPHGAGRDSVGEDNGRGGERRAYVQSEGYRKQLLGRRKGVQCWGRKSKTGGTELERRIEVFPGLGRIKSEGDITGVRGKRKEKPGESS